MKTKSWALLREMNVAFQLMAFDHLQGVRGKRFCFLVGCRVGEDDIQVECEMVVPLDQQLVPET